MRFAALLVLTALSFGASPVITDPAKTGLDPARLKKIPLRMKDFVDQGKAAGIVTLVARHGQIAALDAAGYTDIETKQPIRTDAIFRKSPPVANNCSGCRRLRPDPRHPLRRVVVVSGKRKPSGPSAVFIANLNA